MLSVNKTMTSVGAFQCLLVSTVLAGFALGMSISTPAAPETSTPKTTPSPTCEYNGQQYNLYEWWQGENPCIWCMCEQEGPNCMHGDCAVPECYDYVYEPGQCCPTCPNGPGFYTPSSPAIPTTTPTPVCEVNGNTYQPGDSFNLDACTFCHCDPDGSGQHYCAIADCFGPECVDAIYDPTQCCPLCPNGPNCQHGDTVIPRGETVTFETGETCMCDDMNHWNLEAVCMMTPTTPEYIVESPTSPPPPPSTPGPPPTTTTTLFPTTSTTTLPPTTSTTTLPPPTPEFYYYYEYTESWITPPPSPPTPPPTTTTTLPPSTPDFYYYYPMEYWFTSPPPPSTPGPPPTTTTTLSPTTSTTTLSPTTSTTTLPPSTPDFYYEYTLESSTPPPPPPSTPSQPPTTTTTLSPREARKLEKAAQRQTKQEARQAKRSEREARKAARKAQRAKRRAKKSPES